ADKPADLISGNIDCAIRGGPMEDSTLIARKIGEATLVTCATPGYLQRYGTPASPAAICALLSLMPRWGSVFSSVLTP
uniref:LysR substrate-binding domain-containing protein n=1 Tax=Klebsiella pneumoniae TaxID=573 RepID=UPI003DA94E84